MGGGAHGGRRWSTTTWGEARALGGVRSVGGNADHQIRTLLMWG